MMCVLYALLVAVSGTLSLGERDLEGLRRAKRSRMENHNNGQPDGLLLRSTTHLTSETRSPVTTSSDFVLQWGNRKRMRCMKVQVRRSNNSNNHSSLTCPAPVQKTTVRVNRRVVKDSNQPTTNGGSNSYLNLRQRTASPPERILRNSENSIAMRGHSNGMSGFSSPDRVGAQDKRGSNNHEHVHGNGNTNDHNGGRGGSASSETANNCKKGGGGSSWGSDAMPGVWPPKFVIALTNKEKEEDFLAIKGSKLLQRPKKRAKFIQRTVNLICPGAWLCDLTSERYEITEKKVSKKRPRGLEAMGNMESDSE